MAQPALNQAELAKALRKLKTTSRPPTVITESKPMVKQLPPKSNKPQIAKNVKRYPECVQANAKHVSPAVKPFTNRPSKPSLPARKTAEPNPPATSHASDGDQRKTMPSKETSTCPIISERPLSSNKPDLPLKPVTQKTILDKPRGIGRRPLPPTPTYGTTAANSDRAPNPEDRCQDITATNEHSGYVGVNSRCSVNGQPGTQSASELQHTCQPGAQSEPHLQHTCARLMFSDGTTMLLSELPRSFVLDGVTHVKQPLMLSSLPPLPNLYRPSFVYLNTAPGEANDDALGEDGIEAEYCDIDTGDYHRHISIQDQQQEDYDDCGGERYDDINTDDVIQSSYIHLIDNADHVHVYTDECEDTYDEVMARVY